MIQKNKVLVLILSILLIGGLISPSIIYAKNTSPTEGVASKNKTYGEGSTTTSSSDFTIQSTQYFQKGTNFIQLVSDNIVTVGGDTSAYMPVDTIEVDLYLQSWDSSKGQWVDSLYVGNFTDYNSSFVVGSKDVNVVKGYYYRTRSVHTVTNAGVIEEKIAYSEYIQVN